MLVGFLEAVSLRSRDVDIFPVANTPAEVTHLLEEIQAKDHQILAYKEEINKRDAALQKWVRLNGGHVPNPKEDAFTKTINDCFDKCEILQAEKDRKSTRLNSSHSGESRMPSSA